MQVCQRGLAGECESYLNYHYGPVEAHVLSMVVPKDKE